MKRKINKLHISLILFLLFLGFALLLKYSGGKEPDYKSITNDFINVLQGKENLTDSLFDKVITDIRSGEKGQTLIDYNFYQNIYEKHGIAILILKVDSLLYWSSNTIPVEEVVSDTIIPGKISHLSNGWYEVREKTYQEYKIKGVILIRNKFHYQNDYLVNEFQKDFKSLTDCRISFYKSEYNIYSEDGKFLCSLFFKKTKELSQGIAFLLLTCYVLAYIFFISFLILLSGRVISKFSYKSAGALFFSIIIIVLRYFDFKLRFPSFIYDLDIFSPKYYANSDLLPSLGDLLLNVLTIFLICIFIFRNLRCAKVDNNHISKFLKNIYSFFLFGIIITLFVLVFDIIKGLIINSNLTFDLNNIFGLDYINIIGFCIVALLFLSFFLLSYAITELIFTICDSLYLFFTVLWSALLVFGFLFVYLNAISLPCLVTVLLLLNALGFYIHKYDRKLNLQAITLYVVLFSLLSTYCFYKYNTYKEKEKIKLLASQLSMEQDPIAEYLFKDVKRKIISDTIIQRNINSEDADESIISKIIQQNYLNGYWSRYNIQVTLCKPGQRLIIKPDNIESNCDSFFTAMISNIGLATMDKDLFFLNNGTGSNSYIAKVPFYKSVTDNMPFTNLYIELYSKFVPKELGYPELLIDKNIKINRDLYNYSYAKYKDNELILQYGKYYYSIKANTYKLSNNEFTFFNKDNYDHLFYKINTSTGLIISKKSETILGIIAPFSYIFIFYCLFVLVFLYILHFPLRMKEINLNFKTRVQISMVSVLVFSFVIIGVSTLYYIINLYNKKNVDNISEKAHSVLIEIEHKLGNSEKITPEMKDYVAELLIKFSNVFFTDINLYTPDGMLIASSRPQIFDEGMISKRMNAEAYNKLTVNRNTLYIHDENIGKLKYLSAYVPFRSNNNSLAGYLNLPYFAKEGELRKEISTFLIAFININVIITALAIIIALLVSNYVTRPMKIIKDKLGQIKLGKKNEKIGWNRKDEIGGLVNEYNRMIDELAESAELLARSERESAWREMAKQVAHEIKNPLTPMKLSIQHLRKSWEEQTPDWDDRFNKFTLTMVEQIESLGKIASEFSDFAKMPKANNEKIDLIDLIESAVALYQDNKLVINIIKPENEQCKIFADKTQILRVLNNLLKNSIQAISEIDKGKVDIVITKEGDMYLVKISDNGIGITEEQKEKIFSPNFTTKTGGMGLGLAMVKNIAESYNGKVWFDSETGIGTTFYITFPVEENLG
ncbi:MAG: ATP-binding protein [Bacteroidales bacterium]